MPVQVQVSEAGRTGGQCQRLQQGPGFDSALGGFLYVVLIFTVLLKKQNSLIDTSTFLINLIQVLLKKKILI